MGVYPGGYLHGGVSALMQCLPRGGGGLPTGCVYPSMQWGRHPPMNRMTERQV